MGRWVPAGLYLISSATIGFLLGLGVPLTGIAVLTLVREPHAIERATADGFLGIGLVAALTGVFLGHGLLGWVRSLADEGRKSTVVSGLIFAGVGAAASISLLTVLALRLH